MKSHNTITYLVGDATMPHAEGAALIVHVCNDVGAWGAGFVGAVSRRWKQPEAEYRRWFRQAPADMPKFALGEVQFVQVTNDIWVANMIGQHGICRRLKKQEIPPVRYEAVDQALEKVGAHALQTGASVHMPRIGCGLAGGRWELIEPLVLTHLCQRGIPVTVYDLKSA